MSLMAPRMSIFATVEPSHVLLARRREGSTSTSRGIERIKIVISRLRSREGYALPTYACAWFPNLEAVSDDCIDRSIANAIAYKGSTRSPYH